MWHFSTTTIGSRQFAVVALALLFAAKVVAQQIVPGERAILSNATIVCSVSFAPNSRIVATASHDIVKVWDAVEAKELATLAFRRGAACIAFSPDGKTLATSARDEPARIYDTRTWKVRHKLQGEEPSTRCVTFSPDGKVLATVGFRNIVVLWDVSTGKQMKSFTLDLKHLHTVAFSPEGTILAAGGHHEAILWDLKMGSLRARLTGHEGVVNSLVFSRDGKTLFTADSGALAKLVAWDTTNGKIKAELLKNLQISGISLSPDGKSLALVGFNPHVHLLDVVTGRPWAQLQKVGVGVPMHSVAFSPDGRLIVGGGGDGGARVWDVPEKKELPNKLPKK